MLTQIANPPQAGPTQSLSGLIRHIQETHHALVRQELPFFEERIAKICANHGHTHPHFFTVQQILQDLQDDLTAHLAKEEQVLFPYITSLEQARSTGQEPPHACFPSVRFPIRMMLTEHDSATHLLERLRQATGNYTPPDFACEKGRGFFARLEAFEKDMQAHIAVENQELFPRAVALEELGQ